MLRFKILTTVFIALITIKSSAETLSEHTFVSVLTCGQGRNFTPLSVIRPFGFATP